MPLGLRFLHTPKKVKKINLTTKNEGIELKSLSDPLLNLSSGDSVGNYTSRGGGIGKSESIHILPDITTVTSTSPPTSTHSTDDDDQPIKTETSCDLVSELLNDEISFEKTEQEVRGHAEINPLEIPAMIGSFFDNNGNPLDEDEDEVVMTAVVVMEPKCFINAAALLDDEEEYVPTPPPMVLFKTGSQGSSTGAKGMSSLAAQQGDRAPREVSPSRVSGIPVSLNRHHHQRRVPISKSFPDIIQTTILSTTGNEFQFKITNNTTIDRHFQDGSQLQDSMIVADSLEEIPRQTTSSGAMEVTNQKTGGGDVFDGSIHMMGRGGRNIKIENEGCRFEPMMTESVLIGGITCEKPPETWVVDFNSFTSEIEGEETSRDRHRRKSTSSNNSLAYFLSMDEVESESEASVAPRKELTDSTDSKKIFSMFVDLGKESQAEIGKVKCSTDRIHTHSQLPIKNRQFSGGGGGGGGSDASTSNLRLRALHSGIPRYPNSHIPKSQCGLLKGGGGSMSSSMAMSSGSDPDMGQFQGISSNRSSLHVANHEHDGSFTSSILSSMEMSALEEMETCQGGPCFKLGMDLLRMFQEGINTDVNISVRGRYVKAHKCILSSRSQYFAAMLSGNWIQKAGNTIHLDEYSYHTVQFTMYHIYSGTNEIPDTIDLIELAALTDMLGLEGLREVISQTIRTRFCHNFHRPCTGCIGGILEFFPLAVNYNMDDLHRKMTKWICKHFVRIWPTKAFANLGDALIEKCLRFSITHLSPENLLDVTLGCDQLLSTMPSIRWTETIFRIVNQLSVACVQFVGENISQVLQSQRFLLFGKGQTWNISRIENTFLEGLMLLRPDEACLAHVALSRLIELGTLTIDEVEWSTMFVDFLKMLRKEVEKYLLGNASKAVLSKNWELLSQEVRKRICATSFLGSDKSGNKIKAQSVKSACVGNAVAAATRNARPSPSFSRPSSGQSQGQPTNTNRSRVSPQQAKVAEPTLRQSPNLSEASEKIPPPLPIAESGHKSTSTKSVASVRPMQSQPQTPVPTTTAKTPNVYSGGRNAPPPNVVASPTNSVLNSTARGGGSKKGNVAVALSKPSTPTTQVQEQVRGRKKTSNMLEKERSFDTSSRVSSAGSASSVQLRRGSISARPTPLKVITPNTTSTKAFNTLTSKVSTPQLRRPMIQEPPPPPPPLKPTFLTNSEKAKAVSKPKLTFRSSRSNSVHEPPPLSPLPVGIGHAAHSRQSSGGSMTQVTGGSRTMPNVTSQLSRYANIKPKTNSEKTIKPPVSPLPKPRFGNTHRSSGSGSGGAQVTTPSNVRSGQSNYGQYKSTRSGNVHGKTDDTTWRKHGGVMDMSSSQMSRSSIETESSDFGVEPKMRTLAEIGRSSTFSKDEPTILGKLDLSMDYDM